MLENGGNLINNLHLKITDFTVGHFSQFKIDRDLLIRFWRVVTLIFVIRLALWYGLLGSCRLKFSIWSNLTTYDHWFCICLVFKVLRSQLGQILGSRKYVVCFCKVFPAHRCICGLFEHIQIWMQHCEKFLRKLLVNGLLRCAQSACKQFILLRQNSVVDIDCSLLPCLLQAFKKQLLDEWAHSTVSLLLNEALLRA